MTLTDKARAGFSSITIRGGRITKWKGGAASYSPHLGSLSVGVSGAALAAALALTPGAAQAGDCAETAPGSGEFVCSGPADPVNDTSNIIISPAPVIVTTDPGFGIDVAAGPAIRIDATGGITFDDLNASLISGGDFAIDALSIGGALSISTNGTATGGNTGIRASNYGTDLTIASGTTTGGAYGIDARNFGSGALTITASGATTGTNSTGITAFNAGTDLTITTGAVTGAIDGINARNNGGGALTIIANGAVTGGTGNGILAINYGTDLSITAGSVSSDGTGIQAYNAGNGALSVTTTGPVTSTYGSGIVAINLGTDLSVSSGSVTGASFGIFAQQYGSGSLTITATGAVNASYGSGISATNRYGTDLTIEATDTTGYSGGIVANNRGTGALSITSSGTATGTYGDGIYARNSAAGTSLTITANNTTGYYNGITARNEGSGALTITSTGLASGEYSGIYATNSANGTGISITANNTTGGTTGIYAFNDGTGALSVTSTGTALGMTGDGIAVTSYGDGMTIVAADSTGQVNGINAGHYGSGALSITSTGTATGTTGDGIRAVNYGTDTTITANNTSGGVNGIYAYGYGSGTVTVTSTGTASGGTGDGIAVSSYGSGITVDAATTTGGRDGINVRNYGSGAVTILSSSATGTRNGVYAYNLAAGTSLSITSGTATGSNVGIFATSLGSGALTITSTGPATGTFRSGILARNGAGSGDMTITAADTTGRRYGIEASNNGTGALAITSTGLALADGTTFNPGLPFSPAGISAFNGASATDLTITANETRGALFGIRAFNDGTGTLSVTSTTATATDADGAGIFAESGANASGVTIASGTASGGAYGVVAINRGTGPLNMTSGTATGTNGQGIYAINGIAGSSLTITSGDATGGANGIVASNQGNGALTITSTGTAAGGSGNGIYAYGGDYSTGIAITSATATGGVNGIVADHYGTGAVTIASVTATGTLGDGIAAFVSANGAGMTITSGDATGASTGIRASSNGSGALTITSTGTATGTDGNGIVAFNSSNGTSLTVNVFNAAGSDSGIVTRGYGSGANTINLTGMAQGGTGSAIDTFTGAGRLTTINLAAGSQVMAGSSGVAIRNDAGNSIVNLAAGATIAAAVRLGGGSDTVNVNDPNATFVGVILDGGDDVSAADGSVDRLNLNNAWSGSLAGANTTGWEEISIDGGSLLFSDAAITAGTIFASGGGRLNGSNGLVVTGSVGIDTGSALLAGNNTGTNAMRITGNVVNFGTIDLRGPTGVGAAGDILTIGGNLTGGAGSTIILDIALDGTNTSDQLVIAGNLGGRSVLALNNVAGSGSLTIGDGIRLVDVGGTSDPLALQLAGDTFDVGAFRYTLNNGGLSDPGGADWFLRSEARGIVTSTISIAQTAQTLGLAALGTFNERAGEQENLVRGGGTSGVLKGAWLRAFGSGYTDTATSAALGDTRSNGQYGGLQLGVDLYRGISDSGSGTSVGIFGGLLWAGSDDSLARPLRTPSGTTRSDGWTIGGYLTHVSASDWYVDLAAQRQSLDHVATALDGTTAATQSESWYASVEMGKAFGTKWQIEPQVQLIYGNTDVDDFNDSDQVANRIAIEDTVTGRAGLRLKRTWDNDLESDGGLFSVYAKANVWRQLSGGDTTVAVGVSAPALVQFREVWGDVGLGSNFSLGGNLSAFVDAEVEFGLDQGATAMSGRTGIALRF